MNKQSGRFFLAICVVYALMALFCYLLPYASDDYRFWVASYSDIITQQKELYYTWSGRMMPELFMRVVLMQPKWLSALILPVFYVGIVWNIIVLAFGREWRSYATWRLVLFLHILLWCGIPAFGEVFFWITGTMTYSFSLFMCLTILSIHRLWLDNILLPPALGMAKDTHSSLRSLFCLVGMCILGFIGGWTHETTSPIAFAFVGGLIVWLIVKKKTIPPWMWGGFVFLFLGIVLMITAPGNYARGDILEAVKPYTVGNTLVFGSKLLWRVFSRSWLPEILLLFSLYRISKYSLWKSAGALRIGLFTGLLGAIGFMGNFFPIGLMLHYKMFPSRTATLPVVFMMVAALAAIYLSKTVQLFWGNRKLKILMGCACVVFLAHTGWELQRFSTAHRIDGERQELYRTGAGKDIVVQPFPAPDRYMTVGKNIDDVDVDPMADLNQTIAKRFDLKSLVVAEGEK